METHRRPYLEAIEEYISSAGRLSAHRADALRHLLTLPSVRSSGIVPSPRKIEADYYNIPPEPYNNTNILFVINDPFLWIVDGLVRVFTDGSLLNPTITWAQRGGYGVFFWQLFL